MAVTSPLTKPRQAVLIDPNAIEPDRKTRNLERERRKRERDRFRATHPLCKLYEATQFAIWAREECLWPQVARYHDAMCSAYANLSPASQEKFTDVLPNPPDYLYVMSSWAWIAYLSALLAVPSRREALLTRIVDVITAEFGGDYLPILNKAWVYSDNALEPPF